MLLPWQQRSIYVAFSQRDSYSWKSILEELQRCSGSSPKVLVIQVHHATLKLGERGHKVRLVVGSGLRPDTWERFVRRFGPLQVLETYGLLGNAALGALFA